MPAAQHRINQRTAASACRLTPRLCTAALQEELYESRLKQAACDQALNRSPIAALKVWICRNTLGTAVPLPFSLQKYQQADCSCAAGAATLRQRVHALAGTIDV